MEYHRRRILGLVGLGAIGAAGGPATLPALAGGPRVARVPEPEPDLVAVDTAQFALPPSPAWWADGRPGDVSVIDSRRREGEVLRPYADHIPERRWPELRAFGRDIDYDSERLVLVEAVGQDACHDVVEVLDVGVRDRRLEVSAAVSDGGRESAFCAQVLVFPSVLVRVTYGDEPLDAVAAELTDSWGETSVLTADADEPVRDRPTPHPSARS